MPFSCAAWVCFFAVLSLSRAADATRTLDYTARNTPFAPEAAVKPPVQSPAVVEDLQNKRVTPGVIERKTSPVGSRKAAIDVTETRPKSVQEKVVKSPDSKSPARSDLTDKRSGITTATQVNPQRVSKYQESLVAASATNMARFPAVGRDTTAKVNRFVFRKNAGEPVDTPIGAPISPAAGGSPIRK